MSDHCMGLVKCFHFMKGSSATEMPCDRFVVVVVREFYLIQVQYLKQTRRNMGGSGAAATSMSNMHYKSLGLLVDRVAMHPDCPRAFDFE